MDENSNEIVLSKNSKDDGVTKKKPILVVAGIAIDGQKVLVLRRNNEQSYAGFWEFPGGKVHPGEDPKEALKREIKEELGLESEVGAPLAVGKNEDVIIIGYELLLSQKPFESSDHDKIMWVTQDELLKLPLSPADYELAVDASPRKKEIVAIHPWSLARIFSVLYFFLGIPMGFISVRSYLSPEQPLFVLKAFGFVLVGAFMYAFIGMLIALVGAFIYNFIAKQIGGVEITLR